MPSTNRRRLGAEEFVSVARYLDDVVRELKRVVALLVTEGHESGATWDEIGATFGVTRQAAHERFGPNSRARRRNRRGAERLGHR